MRKALWMALAILPVAVPARADVTVNGLFADHAVLQRDRAVPVYGTAVPGEQVMVSLAGQARTTTADQAGRWSVTLEALKASTNAWDLVVTGRNKIVIRDVLVGDIWVCSGQSNMEFYLRDGGRPADIREAHFPCIRQFHVPESSAPQPREDVRPGWTVCSPQSAGQFTAAGFYFARKVFAETGIPIGLINSTWGGVYIEPWISPDGLATIPELAAAQQTMARLLQDYRDRVAATLPKLEAFVAEARQALERRQELPPPVPLPTHPLACNGRPGKLWYGLYFGMIHPLTRSPIKGVLWYQGENNGVEGEGEIYFHKMRALIAGWRKAWNQGDFPVYFVQLANHGAPNPNPAGGDGWAELRMAQTKALSIPNTGMAVAADLGNPDNWGEVHYRNKQDVGERLARWALARDYGRKDLACCGPIYKELRIEGDKARILFEHTGSGLMVGKKSGFEPVAKDPQGKLQRFAMAGEDRKWVWADAVIDGRTVVVSSPSVPKPAAVRYAFTQSPQGLNLYSNEGLPAAPFRTDAWPLGNR